MPRIDVVVVGRNSGRRSLEVSEGSTVLDILNTLHIFPDGVICFIRDEPVPLDEKLYEPAELTVVEAASGG